MQHTFVHISGSSCSKDFCLQASEATAAACTIKDGNNMTLDQLPDNLVCSARNSFFVVTSFVTLSVSRGPFQADFAGLLSARILFPEPLFSRKFCSLCSCARLVRRVNLKFRTLDQASHIFLVLFFNTQEIVKINKK